MRTYASLATLSLLTFTAAGCVSDTSDPASTWADAGPQVEGGGDAEIAETPPAPAHSCADTPLADRCIEECVGYCRSAQEACGAEASLCLDQCVSLAVTASEAGCGPEMWGVISCASRHSLAICTEEGARVACGSEQDTWSSCVEAHRRGAARYEPCEGSCGEALECRHVGSPAGGGTICTNACSTDAQCGPGGRCVSLDGVDRLCVLECETNDECGPHAVCDLLHDDASSTFVTACVRF